MRPELYLRSALNTEIITLLTFSPHSTYYAECESIRAGYVSTHVGWDDIDLCAYSYVRTSPLLCRWAQPTDNDLIHIYYTVFSSHCFCRFVANCQDSRRRWRDTSVGRLDHIVLLNTESNEPGNNCGGVFSNFQQMRMLESIAYAATRERFRSVLSSSFCSRVFPKIW